MSAKLWTTSPPIDSGTWTSRRMELQDGGRAFAATGPKATGAAQAARGEAEYEQDGLTCWLTTEYKIVKRSGRLSAA